MGDVAWFEREHFQKKPSDHWFVADSVKGQGRVPFSAHLLLIV